MRFLLAIISLTLLFFSGCIHNKIRYIHDKNEIFEKISEYANKAPEYKLQKKDILYIKIASTNKEINEYFRIGANQQNNSQTGHGNRFYLSGFTVNDTGFVVMPVLGSLYVEGSNIKEVEELVQKKTNELLNNAIATVKLVSFNITFLGEINSQGKIAVMQDEINILDAIALAGGIGDYGNKKNVLVVRQTIDGTKTFRVDLTERKLLTSEKFYMLPNDIVIVEPLKSKSFQLGVRDYSLVLTTLTSTITMVLLVINLLK